MRESLKLRPATLIFVGLAVALALAIVAYVVTATKPVFVGPPTCDGSACCVRNIPVCGIITNPVWDAVNKQCRYCKKVSDDCPCMQWEARVCALGNGNGVSVCQVIGNTTAWGGCALP
jgi:hypothetical protein